MHAGGDLYEVKVRRVRKGSTTAVVLGKVEDQGEGIYRVVYVASFAGTYEVDVTSKGTSKSRNRP